MLKTSASSSVSLYLMVMADKEKGRPSRFRSPKSASEEQVLADEAVPSSTKYKNKWALKIFREWQPQREMKVPILDSSGPFKDYELHKINPVSCEIEKRHLGHKNGNEALNPLDAHDKRYGKLSTLFLLVWYYLFRE